MRRARWFVPILPILLLGGLGGGAPASEEGAGVTAAEPDAGVPQSVPLKGELPAATAAQPEAAGGATGVQSESPSTVATELAAAESKPTAPEQGTQAGAAAQVLVPAPPPPSLQTLVDERRDMLRKRREAMLDAYGGRHAFTPPWLAGYDNAVEQYRDTMRRLYREQRDYSRRRHNSWMDAMCPWSKPQRDWSERRGYRTQMDQLDRQELRDSYLYGRPFAAYGPIPW
jgi:hypothetical protein